MTIRKLEGASALSTLHAVMGAKSPLDEMPVSDVRRIGRSNHGDRYIEVNGRIELALSQLTNRRSSSGSLKATLVNRPRNAPQISSDSDVSLKIARQIAGGALPSDQLVRGLHEEFKHLRDVIRWGGKRRSLTELRELAGHVYRAAAYLKNFPENGQLPKARMAKAAEYADVLQGCLKDPELLSYLFKDKPAIIKLTDALDVILKRAAAAGASAPKNGRPKKQPDVRLPDWDQFAPSLAHLANLAREGKDGKRKIKTIMPEFEQGNTRFTPQLLCAVIVGMAYSAALDDAASTKKRLPWHRRQLKFSKESYNWCEMLWRAAEGRKHNQDATYTCWEEEYIPSARKPSCRQLVRATRRSFR